MLGPYLEDLGIGIGVPRECQWSKSGEDYKELKVCLHYDKNAAFSGLYWPYEKSEENFVWAKNSFQSTILLRIFSLKVVAVNILISIKLSLVPLTKITAVWNKIAYTTQ